MNYMAVERAISNWDGVTGFYPSKEIEGLYVSHNFYWYQEKDREFFWLLPWDLDGSMTLRTGFDHVPEWNEKFEELKLFHSAGQIKVTALRMSMITSFISEVNITVI